jgi:hypothetical protein
MKVVESLPVEIALRTLGDQDRQRVEAWFDHLRSWENDPFIRQQSQKLTSGEDVYVLKATSDLRIFFKLEADRIVLLDLATRGTILMFGQMSGTGR